MKSCTTVYKNDEMHPMLTRFYLPRYKKNDRTEQKKMTHLHKSKAHIEICIFSLLFHK